MAACVGEALVLPIGCSCIAQFQLQQAIGLAPFEETSGLFDWAITRPDATVRLLTDRRPVIAGAGDLEIVHGRVRARHLPGFYLWHIKKTLGIAESVVLNTLDRYPAGVTQVVAQHRHLVGKLGQPVGTLHCLWTNVQPNLRSAVEAVGEHWHRFRLTADRRRAIRRACARLPSQQVHTWFVVRPEDADPALHGEPDVVLLDLPRDPAEYKGAPGLFAPVFERMGLPRLLA